MNLSSVRGQADVTVQLSVRRVRPTDSPLPAASGISVDAWRKRKEKLRSDCLGVTIPLGQCFS